MRQKAITFLVWLIPMLFFAQVSETVFLSENLKIKQVTAGTFVHISFIETEQWGKVGCNGMIVINKDEAVVFDTPTNELASNELIDWLRQTKKVMIKAVVATHFHDDCLGALNTFHQKEIPSIAFEKTIDLAKIHGKEVPKNGFESEFLLAVGNSFIHCKHFGAGHTMDNIVGYYPSEKVLFGGCLLKSIGAGKGNLEDADVRQWSNTVEKTKVNFPGVEIVIPGHGKVGNSELLDYTIQLFKQE